MLAAVNLDDQTPFQANKIQNVTSKWKLPAKLDLGELAVSEQMPHYGFGIGGAVPHIPRVVAKSLGNGPMICPDRHGPLTRLALLATLSHKEEAAARG